MTTVFLKDGTQANLVASTDDGYVVDPIRIYQDEETGEEYTEPSGKVRVVDKVYAHAPVLAINEEFKQISLKVEEQEKLLREKRSELSQLEHKIKNLTTDLSRYIINREELRLAKRLILFDKDGIAPKVLDGLRSRKFTVSYEISQYKGEEKCWSYHLWTEDRESGSWSNSTYFDPEYGIMVDLTDEQIKEKTFERQNKRGIKGFGCIATTPDEWLCPEFLAEKKRLNEQSRLNAITRAEEELLKAKANYDRLVNKATEVIA